MCAIPAQKQRIGAMVNGLLPGKNETYLRQAYHEALRERFNLFKGVSGEHISKLIAAVRLLRKLQNDNNRTGGRLHDFAPEKVAKLLNVNPDVIRNEIRHFAFYGTYLNKSDKGFCPDTTEERPKLSKRAQKALKRKQEALQRFEQGNIGCFTQQKQIPTIPAAIQEVSETHSTKERSSQCDLGSLNDETKASAPRPCSDKPIRTIQNASSPGPAHLYVSNLIDKQTKAIKIKLKAHEEAAILGYYRDGYDDEDCPPTALVDELDLEYQKRKAHRWFHKSSVNETMWNRGTLLPKTIVKLRLRLGNFTSSLAFVA